MRRAPAFRALSAGVLLAAVAPWPAVAQDTQPRGRDCDLQFRTVMVGGQPMTHLQAFPASPGRSNYFAGGGVDAICANTDQRVTADSAEQYGDLRLLVLIGNVHYTEQRVRLDADRVLYYMGEERLVAEGRVVGRTSGGTRFAGPRATYLRAKAGLRDRSRLEAGGRPEAWISGSDAGIDTTNADSTRVVSDTLTSDNDSLVYARGRVLVERADLAAYGDSAMLDQGREFAALRQQPRVEGRGERRFTLVGAEIDVQSRRRQAEHVRSAGNAVATSDEVKLAADTIDLRLVDGLLSRATAWGPSRAQANQPGREITADSIEVALPDQVLRRIVAVRRARAESLPDSTTIRSTERDWFAGDTIVAEFDSLARGDTAKPAVRVLHARGAARSWQQAARDNVVLPDSQPAISYVAGRVITAEFNAAREIAVVRVSEQVSGILLQPAADSTRRGPPPVRRPPEPRRQR